MMGAITSLLMMPVMAPVWGFRFVLERLRDEADAVLRDEGRAFGELSELSMRRSAGRISDAEYVREETELLERLGCIREQKDELMRAMNEGDDGDAGDVGDASEEGW